MLKKLKTTAMIKAKAELCPQIYDLWLYAPEVAKVSRPGQFLSIYCKDGSRLLPRPISICDVDDKKESLRIVFRIAGKGTDEISHYEVSDNVDIMGPLGNGFTLDGYESAILFGGGIGIPPMLQLAKNLTCKKTIVLGYRDDITFLAKEFEPYGDVIIATEDGSVGIKGNVIDAIKKSNKGADIILACGPTPMLRGIKAYAAEKNIKAQLSLEEKMACGIGACLACVCKSKETDHHTHVNNKRICKDGPVFFADEIEL